MSWNSIRRILIIVGVLALVTSGFWLNKVQTLLEALHSPTLPPANLLPVAEWNANQNWSAETSQAFHFKDQGSRTLPIPLTWLLALEQPAPGALSFMLSSEPLFTDNAYLSRFGFVPRETSSENPHGLPIGFATTPYQEIAGVSDAKTAVGFTCAACHTGQLIHNDKRYLVEGGSAVVDLGKLTLALGAALGQTGIASDLPVFSGRFDRFAHRVLGSRYSPQTVGNLKKDLARTISILASQPNGIDVVEGYGRLDALNRIGNQVFSADPERVDNYVNIHAPVNYPHIWTSSWFNWVQYDGSIMKPLVRNAGEAMGTAAHTDFFAPIDKGRFSNAIPMANLDWIERQLAGPDAPMDSRRFSGLHAPEWPEAFGAIDTELASKGAELYDLHCAECHRPALTQAVEDGEAPDDPFWSHFRPIAWEEGGNTVRTERSYLDVKIVLQRDIGTDPGQGEVLARRTVNTASGQQYDNNLGIDISVCVRDDNGDLITMDITDGPMLSYPLALGAVVELGINQWLASLGPAVAEDIKADMDRPNCLQAGQGYKARPLNGVWATPPFLHNGAVPSVRHLLGSPDERPDTFVLGYPEYDPVDVGIVLQEVRDTGADYTDDGYFIMRTSVPGNSNAGHEFRDDEGPGRIGPALAPEQIDALIEFLKTI